MKKNIFTRILTFILACSMLLSEIPAYAVGDMPVQEEIQEIDAEEIHKTEEVDEFQEIQKIEEIQEIEETEAPDPLLQEIPVDEPSAVTLESPAEKVTNNLIKEDWAGTIKEDGTVRIDAYIANEPDSADIPEEIDGYLVTEIGDNAFADCETLTEVLIPEGIISIGNFAFFNCTNLEEIELPGSIEFIGENAFSKGDLETEEYEKLPIIIHRTKDSYADLWAVENGYDVFLENSDNVEISIQKIGNQYYLYDTNGNKLTGYVKDEENKYFSDQNGVLKSGWIKIENVWHYFDESGEFVELEVVLNDGYLYTLEDGSISYFKNKTTLLKNSWLTYAKSRYYFDENGFAVKGWHQDGTYWYYADEITGKMTNTEKVIGENTYYFDGNYRLSTGWKKINNVYRYFNTEKDHEKCYEITMDGTNGWVNMSNEKRAYLNGSSGPVKGWKVIGPYKYHFDNDGFLDVGEFQDGRYFYYAETESTEEEPHLIGSVIKGIQKVGDHVYGYHTKNYYRLTGWQTIDGKRYYFKDNYAAETGWFQDGNKWYYAEPTDVVEDELVVIPQGSAAKGLKKIDGKTYLFHSSSYYRLTGWQTINKQKRYFDEDGVMQTGWFKVGDYWYHADEDGIVKSGLQTIDEKEYYFDGNYRLKTGWIAIGSTRYYFDGAEDPKDCFAVYSGTVTKGWVIIDGRKSYFNSSLKTLTGWQTISKQRYYFDANGILQTGWFHNNGYDYYADADGIVKKGLVSIPYGEEHEEKLYYFDSSYRQKTGWQTISGIRYFFENAQEPENRYAANTELPMEPGWLDLGNGQKSYVNKKGAIVTEWKTIEAKKYYFGTNGILQTGWFNVKGYYYYADADGSLVQGFAALPSRNTQVEETYYFDNNYRQKTGWQTIKKQRYYFNVNGELQTGWFTVGNNRYYGEPKTTEDGILKGTLSKGIKVIDGETYLFHASSYYMQTGFKSYGGKRYYFQKDGTARTGWFSVGTDRYYGEKTAGAGIYKGTLASGAKEIDGNTYFFHTKSNYRLTGWQTVGGQRYYLNADGTAKTGWFTVKNLHYYAEPETTEDGILKGALASGAKEIGGVTYVFHSKNYNRLTGWQTVNKKKYYLQSNGIAKTGWIKIGGDWYYGAEHTAENVFKGAMETGIREIAVWDGENTITHSYCFDSKHRLTTGWKTIGGVRYYFYMDEKPENCYLIYSGAIVKKSWYTYSDGTKSYMDNKGNPVTGWKTIDGNKYYFNSKGIMQTGWCTIGGADYYFDQDGAYVPMNAPGFKSISSTIYRIADVTWKSVADAQSYRLEYSVSSAFPSWKTTSVVFKNTSICEYRAEDLEPGTTYYFRIRYTTKKSIAGIEFKYNSPYSAVKSIVVCDGVAAAPTSAVISACEITSGSRLNGIEVRIKATLQNRIKSADDKYYIVETESYGNAIDLAQPVGSVDKSFEIDTLVLIDADDEGSTAKECVDRALMNKFALAIRKTDGSYQVISEPMGITNPEMAAENKTPILRPTSKKGLQGIGYEQAQDTNSKNTLFNLDLASVVGNGPADGYVEYKYKGKTYYFSDCNNLIGEFKALEEGIIQYAQEKTGEKNKVCVTLNLLLSYKKSKAYLIDPAARQTGYKYYTLNMREEKARETYEAVFMYLGELFGKSDCYVTHWVLGNEVNSSRAWNYQGGLSFNTYMQVYASAFRLLYNGVKASKIGNNVYISLDNGWTAKPDTHAGKTTLDKFAEYAQSENPQMLWSIAYHGYSYPLTRVDFWNDNTNTTFSTSTKYISMKNISVLTDYAARLEEKYKKPEGSIRVILSEQGYTASGQKDVTAKRQAEALARGYYMAEFNDRIDAFIIRAIIDDAEEMKGNLYFGLKTYTDVKRITFYTYEFMDSNLDVFASRDSSVIASSSKNQEKVREAQKILGSTDWISLIPGFDREKLAKMY